MKEKIRIQKGITLISLIIIIVVVIMLSSVIMASGFNYDIINITKNVAKNHNEEEEKDGILLKIKEWLLLKSNQTEKTFFDYLKENYGENKVLDNGDRTYTVVLGDENAYIVQENGTIISTKGIFIETQGMPLMLEEGKTVTGTLKVTIVGIEGEITWSNENNNIATISSTSGESITVTAIAEGKTKVIASCGEYKAEYIVKVSASGSSFII